MVGALKAVYWLAKEEIAHTTKYASLIDLAKSLGCDYLKELNVGRNATYTSEMIIAEFLKCLPSVIEERLSSSIKTSPYIVFISTSGM